MRGVLIPDKKKTEEKISKIINGGTANLHVVSDFDWTLTKYFSNGKKAHSSISQIREGGYLSEAYTKRAFELHSRFHKFETDETIPLKKRAKKMEEWWREHLKLLVKYKLNREVIIKIIKNSKIKPRSGAFKFYEILHKKKIPLLIFSGGKGEFIEGILEKHKKMYNNMHIISNFFVFNKKGFVTGYKNKIIHTFSKNEKAIKGTPYFNDIRKRKNVILLGDMEGDSHMVDGLTHDVVLKIGFLNHNKGSLVKRYSEIYDILILDDGSMEYVNNIFKKIKKI